MSVALSVHFCHITMNIKVSFVCIIYLLQFVYKQGQLTYTDLDIQEGPNRSDHDGYDVEYWQVAETKQ